MTEETKNSESKIDSLWYYPRNRWTYSNAKKSIKASLFIPIPNLESSVKTKIEIKPGENTLSEYQYLYLSENENSPSLKPYFDEGSFVWGKNRKTNNFKDAVVKPDTTDIDSIFADISKATNVEELEAILSRSKDASVLLAVKDKFAEINKANSTK